MKNIIHKVVVLILSFSNLTGAEEIIPLEIGNIWRYTNENGSYSISRVTGLTNIKNQDWYVYTEIDSTFFVQNTSDGQLEYWPDSDSIEHVLKYPKKKRTRYYDQFGLKTKVETITFSNSILGITNGLFFDFSIETPSDNIKCLIVPGIGVVESYYGNETNFLVSYELK